MISRVAKSRDREKSEILISRRRKNRSLQHWAPTAHQCIIPDKRKKMYFPSLKYRGSVIFILYISFGANQLLN